MKIEGVGGEPCRKPQAKQCVCMCMCMSASGAIGRTYEGADGVVPACQGLPPGEGREGPRGRNLL